MSNSGKWLRILVTDLSTGKSKANVKVPASMANFGMKMAVRFAPADMEGLDINQILDAMKNGGEGKLVEVEDEEKGERVEVFIE